MAQIYGDMARSECKYMIYLEKSKQFCKKVGYGYIRLCNMPK